ncbi:hypothetical protein PHLCEN_2v12279 [Hermanssonia centrifuga]|uniref:Vacuolar ATPase assembly integral membrane protein VMA21 n=1 Tax=Hermanssonia centrifuga TaxID=98765 RepID=A0A2R6NHQ3_9APHY|nr:hypothetical protein PHLCEN_2v12279 [Hermanssonia centrifuga]
MSAAPSTLTAQTAEQAPVLFKLLLLTFALAFAPISVYYLSQNYLWNGNSTYAAITAVVAANIVLVTYIILSVMEENQLTKASKGTAEPETKKTR